MPKHMRVPEPPAFLDLHGGSRSLESGVTPAMDAAITALRTGGYDFWITEGIPLRDFWQAFNAHADLCSVEEWLRKNDRSSEDLEVIFWLTVAVRSEWLRLPKHIATKHEEIYSRIGQRCDDLSHALTETDDLYAGGSGRGMMFAYVLDFLRPDEREPLEKAIRTEQSARGWDGPEVYPRLTVEGLLERIKKVAQARALRGPMHRQPQKRGAERGYFIRRMDQLLACHFGEKTHHAVIAALTSIALNETTAADHVSGTLRSRPARHR